jgi:hypothetical protein
VAAVQREQELLQLVEFVRLDRARVRRAPEHRLERRVTPVAGEERAPEAHERVLLRLREERPAGRERLRQRDVLELRASLEHEAPLVAVELRDVARVEACRRVDHVRARAELVLLRRERERPALRARQRLRPGDELERPDRLGVLDELLGRGLHAVEHRPPDRLALAVVVVEELASERRRVAGLK